MCEDEKADEEVEDDLEERRRPSCKTCGSTNLIPIEYRTEKISREAWEWYERGWLEVRDDYPDKGPVPRTYCKGCGRSS